MLCISSRYCCYVVWVVVDIPVNLSVVFRVLLELNNIFVGVVGGYVFIILFELFLVLLLVFLLFVVVFLSMVQAFLLMLLVG